jgi:acyl-CoA hydrolase
MIEAKTPADSIVERAQVLLQGNLNGNHRLFGGQLMEWIDLTAAAVARRHANRDVTTALVSQLEFLAPSFANDMVVVDGKMVFAGHSSMEVRVDSYVEALDGSRKLINTAYVTLVALDENEHPCPVPALIPQTPEEQDEYDAAEARHEARKRARTDA